MPKTRAEIQKDYRERTNQRLAENGGRVIKLEVYSGTDADIKYLLYKRGLDDERELLTLMIRDTAEKERGFDAASLDI